MPGKGAKKRQRYNRKNRLHMEHAIGRAQQRYKIILTQEDLEAIGERIEANDNITFVRNSITPGQSYRKVYRIEYNGDVLIPMYCHNRKVVVTFLHENPIWEQDNGNLQATG